MKKSIGSMIKNNFPYVSYVYGGYEQVHKESKRFKVELINHKKDKCYLCKNKYFIMENNKEEEKTILYEHLWEKKENINYKNLEFFINNPNIKIYLGVLKEYKNEIIEEDKIQILITEKFDKEFQENGKTQIKNYLKQFLTNNFIEYFLNKVNIASDTQLNRINKKEKNRLIENLKRFTFEIIDFNKDLSKITIGGIDLKNINPKTMESKLTPNLYFAGEIMDLDGPTGGYNLKIAFSTGYLAGLSAGKNE